MAGFYRRLPGFGLFLLPLAFTVLGVPGPLVAVEVFLPGDPVVTGADIITEALGFDVAVEVPGAEFARAFMQLAKPVLPLLPFGGEVLEHRVDEVGGWDFAGVAPVPQHLPGFQKLIPHLAG